MLSPQFDIFCFHEFFIIQMTRNFCDSQSHIQRPILVCIFSKNKNFSDSVFSYNTSTFGRNVTFKYGSPKIGYQSLAIR